MLGHIFLSNLSVVSRDCTVTEPHPRSSFMTWLTWQTRCARTVRNPPAFFRKSATALAWTTTPATAAGSSGASNHPNPPALYPTPQSHCLAWEVSWLPSSASGDP